MGNSPPRIIYQDSPETLERLKKLQNKQNKLYEEQYQNLKKLNQKHAQALKKMRQGQQLKQKKLRQQRNQSLNKIIEKYQAQSQKRQENNLKRQYQLMKSLKNQNKLQVQKKIKQMRKEQKQKQKQIRQQQKRQMDRIREQSQQKQRKIHQDFKYQMQESQARIKQLQNQFQNRIKLQKQLESIKDPQKIKQHVARMKQVFWSDQNQQQFKLYAGKSVIFVGKTSVGKSSLLNVLFKTKVPTSKASCIKQISIVVTYGKPQDKNLISIFDCPGLDQHFDLIKDPYKIPQYMGSISDIYYLYDGFIQEDIIKTFMAMKKKIYLVRTKCDPDDKPEEDQEVKAQDYKTLKKIGLQTKIYFTSKKGGEDNQKLLKDILTP